MTKYAIPEDMMDIVAFDYLVHHYDVNNIDRDPEIKSDFTKEQLAEIKKYLEEGGELEAPAFLRELVTEWDELQDTFPVIHGGKCAICGRDEYTQPIKCKRCGGYHGETNLSGLPLCRYHKYRWYQSKEEILTFAKRYKEIKSIQRQQKRKK